MLMLPSYFAAALLLLLSPLLSLFFAMLTPRLMPLLSLRCLPPMLRLPPCFADADAAAIADYAASAIRLMLSMRIAHFFATAA